MATLAEILQKAGTLENAERIARFLSNDDPKYLLDLQLVLSAQGKFEESMKISDKATELFPNDHRVAFNRGWLVMRQGDLQKGFKLMERGRFVQIWGNDPLQSNKPQWKNLGEDTRDKVLLLYCEAGLGDEIVYSKFIPVLAKKCTKVIIACDSGLMSLFSRIEGVTSVVDKRAATAVYHDYWVPSMSLPNVLNTTFETLPNSLHLKASIEYNNKWKNIIKDKEFKVGIRWAGNPQFEYDQNRTVPTPELISAVSSIDNVKLYSLQRDTNLVYLPENVTDLSKQLETWEDTAAVIENLDLVVTSCTSIAHLSASLGKLTWVMAPIMPYYVWVLPGETTPWYQTVKLFRQTVFGKWVDVIDNVQEVLRNIK